MLHPPTYATLPERVVHYGTLAFTGLVLLFLIAPVLAIVPLSFNAEAYFSYPMPGLSTQWYRDFFGNARWRDALILSLQLAACVTVLATALGTVAALGLSRTNLPWRGIILGMLILPMIVPVIITAVSVFMFYGYFGLIGTFPGLVVAHTVLAAPFVVITVTATLTGFDQSMIRAGASLGAHPTLVFRKVILPLISPGVISGALFAFVTSWDEVVCVLFIGSSDQRTLPRQMFSGIREMISPTITAAATVLITVAVVMLVTVELLRRRSERLRGIRS